MEKILFIYLTCLLLAPFGAESSEVVDQEAIDQERLSTFVSVLSESGFQFFFMPDEFQPIKESIEDSAESEEETDSARNLLKKDLEECIRKERFQKPSPELVKEGKELIRDFYQFFEDDPIMKEDEIKNEKGKVIRVLPEKRLPVMHSAIYYELALEKIFFKLRDYPKLIDSEESLLFHGSSSGSLLIFTDYIKGRKGDMIPTGELIDKYKKPIWTGEQQGGIGKNGRNQENVSTCFITNFDSSTKKYAKFDLDNKGDSFNREYNSDSDADKEFENCQQVLANTVDGFSSDEDVLSRREFIRGEKGKNYEKFNQIQQRLVNLKFPVLYGIRPKTRKSSAASGGVFHEVLLKGGVRSKEFRVIYVPQQEIRFVKYVLGTAGKHIKVKAIESLRNDD